jgi:universal stress protein A
MQHIERILVPTDFGAASDAALRYARALAAQFGAAINLVHVFEEPLASGTFMGDGIVTMPHDLRDALKRAAREQLDKRHAEHAQALPLSTHDLLTGPAAKRIVERAKELDADLIVMGTHARGGLSHLLMGSVAENVVRTAKCPVLTTHEPESEEAAA